MNKEYVQLPIYKYSKGEGEVIGSLLADKEDEPILSVKRIVLNGYGYPIFRFGQKVQFLHRLVMNAPKDMIVDHIYHNLLDCRKENLRIVTLAENNHNRKRIPKTTSGYHNVTKRKNGMFEASITVDGETIYCGRFSDPKDAAQAATNARSSHGRLDMGLMPEIFQVENKNTKPYSSPISGIKWQSKDNRWIVAFTVNGKYTYFGSFKTFLEAERCFLAEKAKVAEA